ncbi:hypothetical protein A2382_02290 [Candidatus Woesebacteria bacterium RIFOXYB1_FULL_38_16]|uniref:Uncharacterized protein n=1 Tax=Candidatus Woesebacteria bacterium RIFOXYB1_FULL_38_16 TaxID=1802538 RepID=A0A1F8CSY6_9BACT|nr:MAG: hypothetical protein A2191_03085 [Candidatus Woesebacteria bacterium RIFOXYA1_FULL_38_9]OGM78858.1 MAG: hypothetical protein A2382_02290 [Candidatus Woesebacteria bacterium RIFOXYB1_FULL_38_16]
MPYSDEEISRIIESFSLGQISEYLLGQYERLGLTWEQWLEHAQDSYQVCSCVLKRLQEIAEVELENCGGDEVPLIVVALGLKQASNGADVDISFHNSSELLN